jgi:hypothetical protein
MRWTCQTLALSSTNFISKRAELWMLAQPRLS